METTFRVENIFVLSYSSWPGYYWILFNTMALFDKFATVNTAEIVNKLRLCILNSQTKLTDFSDYFLGGL